ncbi:lipopolysaccharide biosynthesis protein [Planococcus rifietoensis]|uniref:lipopolysaccharide biosynthesis protein n=1 Tax=Planococcus rifietoensis TaxID=200991 RepID=UPI00384F4E6D
MFNLIIRNSIVKKIFGFSVASWVGAIISLFTLPFITRLFPPAELGKINMFQTYYILLTYLAILGLNQGYIRFYREPIGSLNQKQLFKLSMLLTIGFSILIMIIIIRFWEFFSVQITGKSEPLVALCLSLVIISNAVLTMTNTDNRLEGNVFLFSIQAISMNIAGSASFILAAYWSSFHLDAIIIMTVSYLILSLIFVINKREKITGKIIKINKKEVIVLLKFSLPMVPVILLSYLNTALPKFVIVEYLSFELLGVYSAAISIVTIITLLQSGFNIFWTPFVYENYKDNKSQLLKIQKLITFGMILYALLILIFQDLLYMLLGSSYRESQSFFAFLLIAPISYTIAETTGIGINIAKKSHLNIIVSSVTLVTNLVMSILLIPKFGLLGAAIAVATSSLFMLYTKTMIGGRFYSMVSNSKQLIVSLLLFVVAAITNYIYQNQEFVKVGIILVILIVLLLINKRDIKNLFIVLKGKKEFS